MARHPLTHCRVRAAGVVLLGVASLVCSYRSWAVDPTESLSELNHTVWTAKDGAPTEVVALAQTTDGYLWLASSNGLYRFDGLHFERYAQSVDGFSLEGDVSTLLALPSGDLWIGMRFGGAFHLHDGRLTHFGPAEGLPARTVARFVDGSDGVMWVQTTVGLYRLQGMQWQPVGADWGYTRFTAQDGLHVGAVLATTAKDDRVWVAGTDGVALLTIDRFVPLLDAEGAALLNNSGIVEDTRGGLWLNGGDGVTHIPDTEIRAFLADPGRRVRKQTLTSEDGLRHPAPLLRPVPTAFESGDGRVWFLTTSDAYWIDPTRIARNELPPPVLVQAVIANGTSYRADHDSLRLPSRTRSFEIDYTAGSLAVPSRVRFRYKLEGVDREWQDAGNRRPAFYTNVPPGAHRFSVTAANDDDVWNEVGAHVTLVTPPAFHQTGYFYLLCSLAALALLGQLYLMRIRQVRRQLQAQMGARLDERERIARELHDTLLQSAQGLILMVQGLAGRLAPPDSMHQDVATALDHADELLNEARDRVSDLRTVGLDDEVEKAIARFAAELFKDKAVQVDIVSHGTPRTIALALADDAYRICREALTNVLLHSGATLVTIEIDYGPAEFELRLADNGRGIDTAILDAGSKPGHFGLQGMRERARRLGGNLSIAVGHSGGTAIELTVPAGAAYPEEPKLSGWLSRIKGAVSSG